MHQPGITGMDGIEGVDVTKELSDAPIRTYTYFTCQVPWYSTGYEHMTEIVKIDLWE